MNKESPTPHYNYHSEEIVSHYTTNIGSNNKGKHYGSTQRNVVDIQNNTGTKSINTYNASGKLVHQASKPLNMAEIQKIKARIFIPHLFQINNTNNTNKGTLVNKSRKNRRTLPLRPQSSLRKNRRKTRKSHK